MKHLNKLLLAVMMVLAMSSHAQNSNNPWALSFGVNAVDTRASAGGGKNFLDSHASQAFNVSENWNILPSVSYLSLAKSVGNNFSVGIQGSINKIDKFVVFDPSNPNHSSTGYVVTNPGDLMYYAVDANVRYSFMSLIKSKVIDPSLSLGGGYTWLGDNSFGTVNPGAGLTFWFSENVGLQLATVYKVSQGLGAERSLSTDDYTPDSPSHFQHSLGITFQFGGKDTDGDGIYDKDDACPEVAGLKQFNGCPDTDGDGIIDGSDACPDVFGLAALNGCPDTDGDGIADKDDACPEVAGLAAFQGCPDTDGDGLADKDDKCPTVAGPKSNGGCPVLDADKDGVPDLEDDCPTVAGPASNKGCPEVTPEAIESLKIQARSVFFNSGKSTFKVGDAATIASLDAMREILRNYPNAKFSIEGHTDSDGSNAFNQKLSEDRANSVRNALIEKGVKADNLTAVGFGESKPVASNKTKAGKAQNRRTEVKHVGSIYEGKL
ncbi:OmpA family protein [Flavobacterium franklandianum]|uniref:OmpA family protein n=1 Tax=Flavobacterium franklandianum TaxID=2594430 RepID=A0A553CU21_9FLAO|nr:OmpA family protein [Flavobacterium franklandianum]TRX23456.1 OmpA family protein [Flavobacterium franklandianum]TRX23951.1 OmpA family protein [Flavobacterium franklandianum]